MGYIDELATALLYRSSYTSTLLQPPLVGVHQCKLTPNKRKLGPA